MGVRSRTLQNWEQGRRHPEGPAKALLRVVKLEPQVVLHALQAQALAPFEAPDQQTKACPHLKNPDRRA